MLDFAFTAGLRFEKNLLARAAAGVLNGKDPVPSLLRAVIITAGIVVAAASPSTFSCDLPPEVVPLVKREFVACSFLLGG